MPVPWMVWVPHLLANMVHMRATTAGANGIYKAHLVSLLEGAQGEPGGIFGRRYTTTTKKTKDML